MNDDTRDALLIAVAEWIVNDVKSEWAWDVKELLKKAKHEQERPTDRGD